MIKVYQTRFGGSDAPIEEQGNCWQAAVASILELNLEDAFDVRQYDQGISGSKWFEKFNDWLRQYGLACVNVTLTENKVALFTKPLGYHLAEVESKTLHSGETHIVVMRDYEVVHDPNPNAKEVGDLIGVYLFVALEAHKLVRLGVQGLKKRTKTRREL